MLALEDFYNRKKTTSGEVQFDDTWFISPMLSQLNYPDIGCISEDFKNLILSCSV